MTNETKISFVLSFVSGFVDTSGFIALFNLFTAHVTGNLVLAGAAFFTSGEHGSVAGKLLMLPVFIVSVAFTSYLTKYKKTTLLDLVLIEALFIACFAILGACLLHSEAALSGSAVPMIASFAVIGMAIQNTYMRKLLGSYTPNTVMTGNFTQFSIDLFTLADYFLFRRQNKTTTEIETTIISFKKVVVVLLGFFAGCFSGAFLVMMIGLICCLFPALLLLLVKKQLCKTSAGKG